MERRLSAILMADMVGYSRLMERDEADTLARQKAHRTEIIDPAFSAHKGRIVKTTGDGLLAEFPSIVEAVTCAASIQRAMAENEGDQPGELRIQYRIGIHLGDVIHEDGDIHGDGVNVAARLEALADPGGVCLSGAAYEQLRAAAGVGYEDMGEVQVKNISRPIRAWRVLLDPAKTGQVIAPKKRKTSGAIAAALITFAMLGAIAWWWTAQTDITPADPEKFAYPLPEKPSIAVLAFDNLTGDHELEYLSDGLSESIIAALGQHPSLFVIARNSSFVYKGKPVKVQTVAEELGVRFVLEGSVQIANGALRATAQLIDAVNGKHVWAEQYDREFSGQSLFEIQDDIARNILIAFDVQLLSGDIAASNLQELGGDLDAYRSWVLANQELVKFAPSSNEQAAKVFRELADAYPEASSIYTVLAWTEWFKVLFVTPDDPEAMAGARAYGRKSLELNPQRAGAYMVLGWLDLLEGDYDEAIRQSDKARELNPGNGRINAMAGWVMAASGQPELCVPRMQQARRLEPHFPAWVQEREAFCHLLLGNFEAARTLAEPIANNANAGAYRSQAKYTLAYIHHKAGDEDRATTIIQDLLKEVPYLNIQYLQVTYRYLRNKDFFEGYLDVLRAAGLPEGPKPRQDNSE